MPAAVSFVEAYTSMPFIKTDDSNTTICGKMFGKFTTPSEMNRHA
jgi:hypothetical protein